MSDLDQFLDGHPAGLLAFGEPTHGEPAFPRARDAIFKRLVGRGFMSIAVEVDRVAALDIDDYVHGRSDTPPEGRERALADWMRAYNDDHEPLSFHGFDAPIEMMYAESPVPYLRALCEYLGTDLGDTGDDARWSDPRAQLDPALSVGRTAEAKELRAFADDLLTALYSHAPGADQHAWERARANGNAALGLLRYHAVAAQRQPGAERTSAMLAVRDSLMAQNLLDIQAMHRSPVLVAAHNRHVQRHPSRWRLAGMDLEWPSAGSILSAILGDQYAVIVGSLGSSAALGLGPPADGTFEGALSARAGHGPLFTGTFSGTTRADVTPEQGHFPLDADTVGHADAIWHVDPFPPAAAVLADRIRALPDVWHQQSGPDLGVPDIAWDDWFFFVGAERKHPFATIVSHDIPGFDDLSGLDRSGVFRLNLDLGREEFRRLFGYGPEEFQARRAGIDFAEFDEFVPHPVYGVQSWASVTNPGPRAAEHLDRLMAHAHRRGARHRP